MSSANQFSQSGSRFSFQFYPVLVISLCACFLFFKYILQVFPSIMTGQLMQAFQVNGLGLGNLAAMFFYAYMLTQLFVGILLDRYSPRVLTALAILISSLGLLIFSSSTNITMAVVSRLMMGLGAAFATVSYMKFAATWFPPRQFALVAGLLASAAMLGAVMGQAPLSVLVSSYGWREALFMCACAGAVLSILFFIVVRDSAGSQTATHDFGQHIRWRDILSVLRSKDNWILTFYNGLAFAPVAVFGGLWGNPFLEEAYHLTQTQAASCISFAFIGLGLGAPILGWLSGQVRSRKPILIVGAIVELISLLLVIYYPNLPISLIIALLFVFGFSSSAFMLSFAIGKEINTPAVAATVIALINSGDALLGAITEPLVGKILDLNWGGVLVKGVRYFSVENYHLALSLIPLYLLLALILVFFIRDPVRNEIL